MPAMMNAKGKRGAAALLAAVFGALALGLAGIHTHSAGSRCTCATPHVHGDPAHVRIACGCALYGCTVHDHHGLEALPEAGEDPYCPACEFLKQFRLTTTFHVPIICSPEFGPEDYFTAPCILPRALRALRVTARSPPA